MNQNIGTRFVRFNYCMHEYQKSKTQGQYAVWIWIYYYFLYCSLYILFIYIFKFAILNSWKFPIWKQRTNTIREILRKNGEYLPVHFSFFHSFFFYILLDRRARHLMKWFRIALKLRNKSSSTDRISLSND